VLILCDGRCGIRLTGTPAGLHMLDPDFDTSKYILAGKR
jgi:hypothetical protein